MVEQDGALTGLGLAEGDVESFCEGLEFLMGLSVADAAAADQHGLLGGADQLGSLCQDLGLGQRTGQTVDSLLQEADGVVVSLTLNVLRQGDADGAGVGGVGKGTHSADHGAHQLLGTGDAVPVAADGAESVVGGDGQVMGLLDLLQHGVGLTAGVDITGQEQHGDVVGGSGGSGGDHVGGAGANGGGDGHDLLALGLLGEGNGDVGHALLVLALVDLHALGLLGQSLTHAQDAAVAGQHQSGLHEGMLDAVIRDVLILQEPDQCLGRGEANSFHWGFLLNL